MGAHGADSELDEILGLAYACTRAWEAWQYGTMTEEDFTPAAETEIRDDLIAWRDAAVAKAPGPVLTESQRFQVQEARDILGTWDLNSPGGVSRETVLADQVRTLLAIIDEKGLAGDA